MSKSTPKSSKIATYKQPVRWLMRFTAVCVVPLFTVFLMEGFLRLLGVGHAHPYFKESKINGQEYLVPDYRFTYLFFPPELARTPFQQRILAAKPKETFRIVLFGESAAYGDPEPGYGFGRQLEFLLEERYPALDFEVVCTAMTAINSHAIRLQAVASRQLDADLWIVYMGNNEMVGAFGASTVFGLKAPPMPVVRGSLALKQSRIGQLMGSALSLSAGDVKTPDEWDGIAMFSENALRHDDPGRLRSYVNFSHNLDAILETAESARVPVLLSTVGSNLRDCAPFLSLHRVNLSQNEEKAWDIAMKKGIADEEAGDFRAALEAYGQAAEIDSEFAELNYRRGRCWSALGDFDQALIAYQRARDYDALGVRADSRINDAIREAARRSDMKGLQMVDLEKILQGESVDGILGREFFYEHVHFTLEGNYVVARIFAERILPLLPSRLEDPSGGWASYQQCLDALAATLWDQNRLWNNMLKRMSEAPFTGQSSNEDALAYCEKRSQQIISRITAKTPEEDLRLYNDAVSADPEDNITLTLFMQYEEAMGRRREAIRHAKAVVELLPDLEWSHFFLGEMLLRARSFRDAEKSFRAALEIRSNFPQALAKLKLIEENR